jgi:hypothetical protein
VARVNHDGCNRLDNFPVTFNVRQFRVRRSDSETDDVISLFILKWNSRKFVIELKTTEKLVFRSHLQCCRNAVEFARSVDLFQKGFCEVVGAFETKYDHAQMAGGGNFETTIRFDHIFKFFGQTNALLNAKREINLTYSSESRLKFSYVADVLLKAV